MVARALHADIPVVGECARELVLDDLRAEGTGDLDRPVRRITVDNDDLISSEDALDAAPDILLFILRDNDGRYRYLFHSLFFRR